MFNLLRKLFRATPPTPSSQIPPQGSPEEDPTLLDYLVPKPGFDKAYLPRGVIRIAPENKSVKRPSTTTTPFRPTDKRAHLPHYVQGNQDMFHRMFLDFDLLLRTDPSFMLKVRQPVSALLREQFSSMRDHCFQFKLANEASVRRLGTHIMAPVRRAYAELTGKWLDFDEEVATSDKKVRTDRIMLDEDGRVMMLIEDKSHYVFALHAQKLWARLTQGPFCLDLQHRWINEDAILSKIARHAMDAFEEDSKNAPNWAIIFGGLSYFIIFIVYERDSRGTMRPSLFCSAICEVDDVKFPITSVALYMMLTADLPQAQKKLIDVFGITIPSPPIPITLSSAMVTRSNDHSQLRRRALHHTMNGAGKYTLDALATAPRLGVRINAEGYEWQMLERVLKRRSNMMKTVKLLPTFFLNPPPFEGAVGEVYRTELGVIVKFSWSEKTAIELMKTEAKVYERLQKRLPDAQVPTYYGLFTCGLAAPGASTNGLAIVISDEGTALQTFDDLTSEERQELLLQLWKIHEIGIDHGDFEPRNVVRGPRGLCIIDFSHAELDHDCEGPDECPMLRDAVERPRHPATGVIGIL